jgi:hypothetical protein
MKHHGLLNNEVPLLCFEKLYFKFEILQEHYRRRATKDWVLEQFCQEENFAQHQSFVPKLPDKNVSHSAQ